MHLPKLPTIFVKGGEERKVFFTVQARELVADGWVEKGTEEKKPEPKAEPKRVIKKNTVKAPPAPKAVDASPSSVEPAEE